MSSIEKHPFSLFLPTNAKWLLLGSFPPPRKRWSMEFYYPNLQNDMWRIFGLLFFADKNYFLLPDKTAFDKEKIVTFLLSKGIAMGDTARSVIRMKGNASDAFLQVVEPLDLQQVLLQLPHCKQVVATGQKSADTLCRMLGIAMPIIGESSEFVLLNRSMRLYRMPSSSRAYPMKLEQKAKFYKKLFEENL